MVIGCLINFVLVSSRRLALFLVLIQHHVYIKYQQLKTWILNKKIELLK